MDADERIFSEDLRKVYVFIKKNKKRNLDFCFLYIYPNGREEYSTGHNPRLFNKSKAHYHNFIFKRGEYLNNDFVYNSSGSSINIIHFVPFELQKKYQDWYDKLDEGVNIAPSQVESFKEWKKFNPQRLKFK